MMWMGLAAAATWTVPGDGAFSDFASQLVSGDVVEFTQDQTLCVDVGVDLTLRGEVTLTANGCDNLLVINDGETVTVEGLRLANPSGRVVGNWYSHVVLDQITVEQAGRDDLQGGAVHVYGGSLTLRGSSLSNAIGSDGGAVAAIWASSVVIEDSVFTANTATGHGGALFTYAVDGPVDLLGSAFTDNQATDGGAVAAHWYHQMTVEDSTFERNSASGSGGALTHWYNSDAVITAARFADNDAGNGGGAISAYGNSQDEFSLSLQDSTLSDNTSGSHGGCLDVLWFGAVSISNTAFSGCEAAGSGGGIRAYAIGTLEVAGSSFGSNASLGRGGAFESQWIRTESITNSLFVGNTSVLGGGIARYAGYDSTITNNTFVDNAATEYGGAAFLEWSYGTFTNNLLMGSQGSGLYVIEVYSYGNTAFGWNAWYDNDVHGGGFGYPSDDDLVGDPGLFGDGDYRLHGLSPLRDAGDPALIDPDGSRSDIGAWGGPGAVDEDRDGDGLSYFADCDDSDPDLSEPIAWFEDADGDGFAGETPIEACFQPDGTVLTWNDCDDTDPDRYPGAVEHRGDGIDQDCDGVDPEPNNPDRTEARSSCSSAPASGVLLGLVGLLFLRRRS